MIGILNEKPSQARNFAKALGGPRGTYEGESYVIVPGRGHLYELKRPENQVSADKFDRYHVWDVEELPWDERDFAWENEPRGDVKDVIDEIARKLGPCDEICIATDVDPTGEGQLLAWEVISELGLDRGRKVTRMYFADEAPASIRKAFKERRELPPMTEDPEWKMASFRSKWDMLSMQWSRVATAFGDGKSVLRQGRLKSFMCKAVGEQIRRHDEFVSTPYWYASFTDDHGVRYVDPDGEHLASEAEAAEVVAALASSEVVVDSKKKKHAAPRRLIDLASLASALAPKGIAAKSVLATYQAMYVDQVVSYPRTEDKFVTPEQFAELLPLVDKIAGVVGVDTSLLTHRDPRKTHVKEGGAHGANRPGPNVPGSLDELDRYGRGAREIYDMVARSYLAMLAEDYEYEAQAGHVRDFPTYKGSANVPLSAGWHAVFGDLEDADEDESANGLGSVATPEVSKGVPRRPPLPTMRWLMRELESHDVGTGATRTSTYAEVTNAATMYPLLTESGGKIGLTKCGQMSYRLLEGTHIGDVGLTERVQAQMRDVAAGRANESDCLAEVADLVRDDIEVMRANGVTMRKELGVENQIREKAEGIWQGERVRFNRDFCGHRFTDEEVAALLDGKEISFSATSRAGNQFMAVGSLGHGTYNGHDYVGFCLDDLPGSWCGHVFTSEERATLKSGGEVKGTFTSKAGKQFDATLHVVKGKLEPIFDVIPKSWCGHTFTKDERARLEAGLVLDLSAEKPFKGKSGKSFGCRLRLMEKAGKTSLVPDFSDDWKD